MSTTTKGGFAYLSREMLEVWKHLGDGERAVLPILMSHLPCIKPSYARIARMVNKHRGTVMRIMKTLEEVGLVVSTPQHVLGRQLSNVYRLADVERNDVRAAIIGKLGSREKSAHRRGSNAGATNEDVSSRKQGCFPEETNCCAGATGVVAQAQQGSGAGATRSSTREESQEKEYFYGGERQALPGDLAA